MKFEKPVISPIPDARTSSVSLNYVTELISLFSAEALGVGFCTNFAQGHPKESLARRHFKLQAELERETSLLLHTLIQRHRPDWDFESSFSERHRVGAKHADELVRQPWVSTVGLIMASGSRYLRRIEKLLAMCPRSDQDAISAVHIHEQAVIEWATKSLSDPCPSATRCLVDAIEVVSNARRKIAEKCEGSTDWSA
jgi:hypothetical protein